MPKSPYPRRTPGADLSRHAATRCRQRGTPSLVLTVLGQGRGEVPVGGGCVSAFLTRDDEAEMVADGLPPDLVRVARRRVAVLGRDAAILTVLAPRRGLRGRRYRRDARDLRPGRR